MSDFKTHLDLYKKVLEEISVVFKGIKSLRCLILFGSVARGEETKDSDVDLLAVISPDTHRTKISISNKIFQLEKKYDIDIQCVFTDKKFDKINKQFLDNILRDGKIICGQLPEIPFQKLDLEPYLLIKYDLTRLTQKEKMKIRMLLFGKETKKVYKGKTYVSKKKGLVKEYRGIRTGIASLLITQNNARKLEKELRRLGVKVRVIPAWLQKI